MYYDSGIADLDIELEAECAGYEYFEEASQRKVGLCNFRGIVSATVDRQGGGTWTCPECGYENAVTYENDDPDRER